MASPRVRSLLDTLPRFAGSLAVFILALTVAALVAYGAEQLKREAQRALAAAQAELADSRQRLARVREDELEIRAKIARYEEIVAQGRTQPERRLDWVERMRQIKEKRRLLALEYEIAPQRPLDATHVSSGGYAFLTSPMKLELLMLHEQDLLHLLADLQKEVEALVSVRQCSIERLPVPERQAQLRAECELDWITLQEAP